MAEWVCEIARQGTPVEGTETLRILILNGPNLNLLGEREPELYGHQTYAELETELQSYSAQNNIEVLIRQSNVEGDLVSLIQSARHWANGIIINPGGYTHTSVAIRDALAAVTLPVIEVHLTDIQSREEFRRISLISPVCTATISGHGTRGYLEAMEQLKHHIKGIT